ncbi:glycosyltransferase family 2 protein [Mycolicibacterium mengxianglii]|uniref:glycosyltransferase family 2 protein n=1 Tax=Mycolicibacterium mengxianglii TaxID=2736649 RepID=UPI0018EF1FDE|nr:glycosyltransferase family 2 protein [Mycolicibacterium mengxianglii]
MRGEPYSPQLPAHLSARTALNRRSILRIVIAIGLIAAAFAVAPTTAATVVTSVIAVCYLITSLDRNWLLIKGFTSPSLITISDEEARAIPDDELPYYTVLVPVFAEPTIMRYLLAGVGRLDYPADKLEVLLLIEEDDIPTQQAVVDMTLPSIRVVLVPPSLPRTKPKACNYGMTVADPRSEMMTIYDAEDIPEPLQLRRAVAAMRQAGSDVGCAQCRLAYFNEDQNLLTRWFAIEYDQWFGVVLPAIQDAKCAVPLGGTSNHMPTAVWREVGGWDEYNVTEDADLGVRLARYGYRTIILDSITLEEANSDIINWIRQRSRWYKGYLQTMIVHLRHPLVLRRAIGTKAVLRLISMTGAVPLGNAFNLLFWFALLCWVAGRPPIVDLLFPPVTYYLCLVLFIVVAPLAVFVGLVVCHAQHKPYLWWAAILVPLYWFLQSVAAIKAIYQLVFRPFFWEKTVHGLSHSPVAADHSPATAHGEKQS